jgi:hypothetical protein
MERQKNEHKIERINDWIVLTPLIDRVLYKPKKHVVVGSGSDNVY